MKSVLRRPTLLLVIGGIAVALLAISALIPGFVFGNGATKHAHAANSNTTPTIVPSTTKVHPNQAISVTATGFTPGETIGLYRDSTSGYEIWLGSIPCNSSGICSGSLTFDYGDVLQGQHVLIAKGQPGETADAAITVLPGIFFATQLGGFTQGGSGSVVTLSGQSFQGNETVNIYWGKGNSTLLGTATTNVNYGYFNATLHLPTGVVPGAYPIQVVTPGPSSMTLSTSFRVIPPVAYAQAGVRSGQILPVHFYGFQGLENVIVSWNANGGQQIGMIQAGGDGSGRSEHRLVTPSAPRGQYTLTLTGQSSGLQSSTTITVGPGIDLSADYMVSPGQQLTVQGGGYNSNEQVRVLILGDSSPSGNATVTTGVDGGFQVTLTAPLTTIPNKKYNVTAYSTTGTDVANNHFYISYASVSFSSYRQQNNVAVYGTTAIISGTGYEVNEQVSLYWNYQQPGQFKLATVKVAADGTFTYSFTVPSVPTTSTSSSMINATGASSTFTASTQVSLVAAIDATLISGTTGKTVQVTGGMLPANIPVTLYLDTLASSGIVGNTTTGSDGSFNTSFPLPTNISGGIHTVYAEANNRYLQTNFATLFAETLTPSSGTSGTNVSVQINNLWSGICAYEPTADLVWSDPVSGNTQFLESVYCTSSHSLNTTITTPTGLVSGHTYEVQVFENGYLVGQAGFTAQ